MSKTAFRSILYERVPQRLASKIAGQIFAAGPHAGDLDMSVRCLARLAVAPPAKDAQEHWRDYERTAAQLAEQFASLREKAGQHQQGNRIGAATLNCHCAEVAKRYLVPELDEYWNRKAVGNERKAEAHKADKLEEEAEAQQWQWHREAEDFLALHVVNLIRQVFAHIQNLMTFLIAMLLCFLFCFEGYPFQPHRLLLTICFALVICTSICAVIEIVRFNRNEVLSRINQTHPNRFTFDRSVFLPMMTFVAAPIFSLLVVQFPVVGQTLFSWARALEQLLRT